MNEVSKQNLLNYIKNYNDGTVQSVIKNKDVNRAVKGIVNIEIYNEDGSLDQEARVENLLNNQAIYDTFYLQFLNRNALDSSTPLGTSYGNIILTDYSLPEDANAPTILGEVIGFADLTKPASTLNPLQGSVVVDQCYYSPDRFQFTAEFNPSKGNGTFQTIWMGASLPNPNSEKNAGGLGLSIRRAEMLDGSYPFILPDICSKDGTIYCFSGNTAFLYDLADVNSRKTLVSAGTINLSPALSSFESVVYVEDKKEFWFFTGSSISGAIKIYDENLVFKRELPLTGVVCKLAYAQNRVFALGRGTNTMWVIDTTTLKTLETTVLDFGGEAGWSMVADANGNFLHINASIQSTGVQRVFVYSIDGNELTLLTVNDYAETIDLAPIKIFNENYFIGAIEYLYKSYSNPGSQTLLPAPVTKSDGQSMKVTYTFEFKTTF